MSKIRMTVAALTMALTAAVLGATMPAGATVQTADPHNCC